MKRVVCTFAMVTVAFLATVFAATGVARAETRSIYHGGTYFGSVTVDPGEVVDGNLSVIFGNATIDGTVRGDVSVVGGSAYVAPGGSVSGQINTVGGDVTRAVVPWAPSESPLNIYGSNSHLFWHLTWDVIAVLFFLIFPLRTRLALGRLEAHPGLAVAAGLLGLVAVIPILVLLAVTIVLIPLIPIEMVALAVGLFIGKAALALLVGRRLFELLSAHTTPSPFAALILGLALITAAEMVPLAGALVSMLVVLVGLGAVILTFVRDSGSATPPFGSQGRSPIGGPPMTVA